MKSFLYWCCGVECGHVVLLYALGYMWAALICSVVATLCYVVARTEP